MIYQVMAYLPTDYLSGDDLLLPVDEVLELRLLLQDIQGLNRAAPRVPADHIRQGGSGTRTFTVLLLESQWHKIFYNSFVSSGTRTFTIDLLAVAQICYNSFVSSGTRSFTIFVFT